MAFADVATGDQTSETTRLSSLFPFEAHSPLTLLALASIGPLFLVGTTSLAGGIHGLSIVSFFLALFSVILLIRWKEKGCAGAIALIGVSFLTRSLFGAQSHFVWESGFFASHALGTVIAYLCFDECVEMYEQDALAVAEDFEQLKEVHAHYTTEKAVECERLKKAVAEKEEVLASHTDEIRSLKNVVMASSAQAATFVEKNKALQEKAFELHKAMVSLSAQKNPASIPAQRLQELNTLRVNHFQTKQLLEQVVTFMHPLRVDTIESQREETPPVAEKPIEASTQPVEEPVVQQDIVSKQPIENAEPEAISPEKTVLLEKEKEKARQKKVYYEQLDTCNALKAAYSKDLSDETAKHAYDEANAVLKTQKATLVGIEKELFSLKKELRDQGKLFS